MRKQICAIMVLAVMGLSLSVVGANARGRVGKLTGRVINSGNGTPIRNLTIEVIGQGQATTDQNGKYVFDNLPVGSYKVIIKSSEFDEHRRTVTIHAGQTTISNFRAMPLQAPRH